MGEKTEIENSYHFVCSGCGSTKVEIIQGRNCTWITMKANKADGESPMYKWQKKVWSMNIRLIALLLKESSRG
jgi:hypothetical protein